MQVYEIEPKPRDHPSSHFRPEQEQEQAGIEVVTPSVGEFSGAKVATSTHGDSTNKTEAGKEDDPAIQVETFRAVG